MMAKWGYNETGRRIAECLEEEYDWVEELKGLYADHRRGLLTDDELRQGVKWSAMCAVNDAIIDAYTYSELAEPYWCDDVPTRGNSDLV